MAAWAIAVTLAAAGCASQTGGVEPVAKAAQEELAPTSAALKPRGGRAWQSYFPNVELTTHHGDQVRFYDDLLKGKTVVINFMYATCEES